MVRYYSLRLHDLPPRTLILLEEDPTITRGANLYQMEKVKVYRLGDYCRQRKGGRERKRLLLLVP